MVSRWQLLEKGKQLSQRLSFGSNASFCVHTHVEVQLEFVLGLGSLIPPPFSRTLIKKLPRKNFNHRYHHTTIYLCLINLRSMASCPTSLSITQLVASSAGALLEGDNNGALTLLQHALAQARSRIGGGHSQPMEGVGDDLTLELHSLPLEIDAISYESLAMSCPGSVFTFHNAALVCEEMPREKEVLFAAELSAMILYNLGLVYHRSAVVTGSTVYFARAMKFYDIATSIVLSPHGDFIFSDDLTTLKISLNVNMGHIYSNFYDQEGTSRCVDSLHALFHTVDWDDLSLEAQQMLQQNLFVVPSQHELCMAPAA